MYKIFTPNQTVYTVNNKTNRVDTWRYFGEFPAKNETLCHLINERNQYVYIPKRCVFSTEEDALKVLNGAKNFN